MEEMDKDILRAEIRELRRRRTPAELAAFADTLARHWPELAAVGGQPTLMLGYQPTRYEPDPRPALRAARSQGLAVWLPRTTQSGALEWVAARDSHLESRQGTLPNPEGPTISNGAEGLANQRTLVLTPALALDASSGIRLGQGGGYYDRWLAEARQKDGELVTVALLFHDEIRDLQSDPHDQPVDFYFTTRGLTRTGSNKARRHQDTARG